MNSWFFYIILLFLNLRSLTNVTERNQLKKEAELAFKSKNYAVSQKKYQSLAKISFNLEPEARLNLSHCFFYLHDTTNALLEYKNLLRVKDVNISSSTMIQLGVINALNGDSASALGIFKEALQKNPENRIARYNFELLSKKLPQKPPKNNSNQNNQAEIEKQSNGGETQKSDEKKDDLETQTPAKMSKEKALQILDAMKTSELQYSQQRKKASNKKDKNAKDW